jgi:UDP-glucose 4-epimerase
MKRDRDGVLITGGAGFIGNHLARALVQLGKRVVVVDDLSTGLRSNITDLEGNPDFKLYVDTVRNESLMQVLMQECTNVYHLASAVGVKLIMERPVHTIDNIYQSTEVVLRFASRYRNQVLIASTSEVYGKSDDVPFRENGDRVEGPTSKHRWAYGCAKAMDEFLALAHWKETRLPVVIVRLFNTVGPRQRGQYGMVLPRFIEAAIKGEELLVYGDGSQSRCFCHVSDVVRALIELMSSADCRGEVFNVGSTEEITIRNLAARVIERLGSASRMRFVPYEEVFGSGFEDMRRRVPSIDKIRSALGWAPRLDMDQIIDDIAAALGDSQQHGWTQTARRSRHPHGE